MKKLLLLALLFVSGTVMAQNVGIGTANPDESAILDLRSSSKGFLLPRLTEKQKSLIPQPAEGLMIYQTDTNQGVYLYQGGKWNNMGSANVTTTNNPSNPSANVVTYTPNYLLTADGSGNIVSSNILNDIPNKKFLVDANYYLTGVPGGNRYFFLDATNTYTGTLVLQAGAGSSGYGGGIAMFGHSHSTNPGSVSIGTSMSAGGSILFGSGGLGPTSRYDEFARFNSNGALLINGAVHDGLSKLQVVGSSIFRGNLTVIGNNLLNGNMSFQKNGSALRLLGFLDEGSSYDGGLSIQAGGGSASFGGGLVLYGNSNLNYPGSVALGTSYGSNGSILFGSGGMGPNSTWKEYLRVNNKGKLLLNTTTEISSELLQVNGDEFLNGNLSLSGVAGKTRFMALLNETNSFSGSLSLQAGGGSPGFGGGVTMFGHSHATNGGSVAIGTSLGSNGNILFGIGGLGPNSSWTEFMRIDKRGYVGIGTNNPSQLLDVAGSIQQSAVTSSVLKADGTGKLVAATAGTDYVAAGTNSVGTIAKFSATGTVANSALTESSITNGTGVKLDSKSAGYLAVGDFGAGTPMSIPTGYRLVVQDGIITEKVKVAVRNQTDWADYVFEPNYSLMPLNEVELFVKENKHLPNVPSADQMVEQGVEVGKTSKMFMEKIEELTLYLIELKKEVEALKAENAKLKK